MREAKVGQRVRYIEDDSPVDTVTGVIAKVGFVGGDPMALVEWDGGWSPTHVLLRNLEVVEDDPTEFSQRDQ